MYRQKTFLPNCADCANCDLVCIEMKNWYDCVKWVGSGDA